MADESNVKTELSRDLSLFQVTLMGLGMMVGAGVFIGIGHTLFRAGPGGLLITFALNGLIAFFTCMSLAEMSSAIPRAGGSYNFARIGFGKGTSFVTAWMQWFASAVAGSLYAVVFATYTLDFLVQLGWMDPSWLFIGQKVVAAATAMLFIYINYSGTSDIGKVGTFFTVGQMSFVFFIAIVGIATAIFDPVRWENFQPFIHPDGWLKILVTMGFIYVAFEGFEVIAQAGDEVKDPKRNIPKAMLYSVAIVTVTYILISIATVVSVSPEDPTLGGQAPWQWIGGFLDTGFGKAVSKLLPGSFLGFMLVTLAVVFSSTSALNATIYSATRVSYALGRDGMLPGVFARISPKTKTPVGALMFSGGIVLLVAILLPTQDVASSASIMFISVFFIVNLCVIRIRARFGNELDYGFVMPLFPLFPILAIICQAVLVLFLGEMSLIAWIAAPCWIAIGIIFYFVYGRAHAKPTPEDVHVLEEKEEIAGYKAHSIMLAVANPENAKDLVHQTRKLAEARGAAIELLHMVRVPGQTPLEEADKHMAEGREGISTAMEHLGPEFHINSHIRYCRSISRGIVSTVREKQADMLVMGWHGKHRGFGFHLGSTIDPIIERTTSDVIVLKNLGDLSFKNILVPLAGGPNSALALETASILAEEDGQITAFTMSKETGGFDIRTFVEEHVHLLHLPPEQVEAKVGFARDVVSGILEESEQYDLIVMGATGVPLLGRVTHQPLPETIASRSLKPIVMVRAAAGWQNWVRRLV